VLYVQSSANPSNPRLLVPNSLRVDVIKQMHDNVAAGHQEVKRTKSHIGRNFYWYDLKTDVKLYIEQCYIYEANKKPLAPMGHLKAGDPRDLLSIDFLGPLPLTEKGHRFILVASDYFTKYVKVIPVAK